MAALISVFQLSKAFATKTLFQDITFGVNEGQKVGLIGPNGAGKSTLLQILAGLQKADEGEVHLSNRLRLGYLAQSPEFAKDETVYEALANATDDPYDSMNLSLIHELISKFDLDDQRLVSELSGGWKKRVALARELVKRPNLLLLDEPTNHLDLPSIFWLEEFLARQTDLAVVTITHDRLFLQNTCDTIFDLDSKNPDGLIKFTGSYDAFLEVKEAELSAQQSLEEKRRNLLRRETEWLRRGAQARQTKQKARIERAGDLRDEVSNLASKNLSRRLDVDFGDTGKGPKKLIEAKGISKTIGDRVLFSDLSLVVGPQSRIGLLGANGCGKSTLIRQLIGMEPPDTGEVIVGENVGVAYFEQQKESLDPQMTVLRTICPAGDYVDVQGHSVFAKSYLARFHFRSEQMDLPVSKLSGGEKSRLLIARLMMRKENVLVLDEPTNDLDIATLDVLQDALVNFAGAVILVTHDRYFMDQVANQLLAFTGDGTILRFADFFQWDAWYRENRSTAPKSSVVTSVNKPRANKLTYKEQREWDGMESAIELAEAKLSSLQQKVASVASDFALLQETSKELNTQQAAVDKLYARWAELSSKRGI